MNGFPSVQYMTVWVFLISSQQKFTAPNALRAGARSSRAVAIFVPVHPACGRYG
jgi:hypothetical protein